MRLSRQRGNQKGSVADLRTLYGRLQASRLAAQVTYKYIAKRLVIAEVTARAKFTGFRAINTDEITLVGFICKVQPRWIMTGEGPIPTRIKNMLPSMNHVDLQGGFHSKRYLTELELVMGPYMSDEAREYDRTDLTLYWEPLSSWMF